MMPGEMTSLTKLEKYFLSFLVILPIAYLPLSPDDTINFLHTKFLVWLIWLLLLGYQISQEKIQLKFRKSDWLLAFLLLWLLMSQLLHGQHPFFIGLRLEGFLTTLALFTTYLLTRETASLVRWTKVLELWPLYVAIPVLFGIYQYLFPEGQFNVTDSVERVVHSTYGNRAAFAALLMLFVSSALLLPVKRPAWAAMLLPALLGFSLAVSQTRTTWAAVAGMIAVLLAAGAFSRLANLRSIMLSLIFGAAGFGLALSVPDAHRDDHFAVSSGREVFWPIAVKAIQEKPMFGWGTGGFKQAFDQYADWQHDPNTRDLILLSFGSQNPKATSVIEQDDSGIYIVEKVDLGKIGYSTRNMVASDKAHNEYLDLTVQYGLPFLIGWLTWIASVFTNIRKIKLINLYQLSSAITILGVLSYNIFWMNSITYLPIMYIFLGLMNSKWSDRVKEVS